MFSRVENSDFSITQVENQHRKSKRHHLESPAGFLLAGKLLGKVFVGRQRVRGLQANFRIMNYTLILKLKENYYDDWQSMPFGVVCLQRYFFFFL